MRSILVIALFCCSHLLQAQNLIPDYTGQTQNLAPEGWIINSGNDGQVFTWSASPDPNSPGAPSLLLMGMADFAGSSAESLAEILGYSFDSVVETDRLLISADECHYRLYFEKAGTAGLGAGMFQRDASQGLVYFAVYVAGMDEFEKWGGDKLLYDCFRLPYPYETSPSDVAKSNIQNAPATNQEYEQSMLVGSWIQAFSYSTGSVYENAISGELSFGERGYGHLLELKANGGYTLTYRYVNVDQGTRNEAQIVESGNYSVEGDQLILDGRSYKGFFLINGTKVPEQTDRAKALTFTIIQSGDQLRLIGQPFEYSISLETDANGQPYIDETFTRQ